MNQTTQPIEVDYNPKTATKIASYETPPFCRSTMWICETLYKTPSGEFFIYVTGSPNSIYGRAKTEAEKTTPITPEQALKWQQSDEMKTAMRYALRLRIKADKKYKNDEKYKRIKTPKLSVWFKENKTKYDVETATKIETNEANLRKSDLAWFRETLYKTPNNAFFLHVEGGPMTSYGNYTQNGNVRIGGQKIAPLSEKMAMNWSKSDQWKQYIRHYIRRCSGYNKRWHPILTETD